MLHRLDELPPGPYRAEETEAADAVAHPRPDQPLGCWVSDCTKLSIVRLLSESRLLYPC